MHLIGTNDGVGFGVKGENATPPGLGNLHVAGVVGTNPGGGPGVFGTSGDITNLGIFGSAGRGVQGASPDGPGIEGVSGTSAGVVGTSKTGIGVRGFSQSGDGVVGRGRRGVVGESDTFQGVFGKSIDNAGVVGESDKLHAVFGICHNPNGGGIFGTNDRGGFAGVFDGKVAVSGNIECKGDVILQNADCAEDFDIAELHSVEPGTVMVLGDQGALYQSNQPYDKRVAGVVSGGGDYKPGIVLDKRDTQANRKPIALLGKVYCKVDANYSSIEVGDLLTTSPSPGQAMKATDRRKAFGAVIGKALAPLKQGQGLIPILIALQ